MKGREIMKKKLGFTLAEVLITLGIIGVVAAMTIPTLMTQTNGAEFRSGFKKALSSLNQAITMNVALDNQDFSDVNTATAVGAVLQSRLNVINSAIGTAAVPNIGANFAAANYTLLLNDGMAISFYPTATSCSAAGAACRMIIDVNGNKKPNTLSTATNDATKSYLSDQFVVDFYNQIVTPHDNYAKYALYN